MLKIALTEQESLALYRILRRWEFTGELTVEGEEETARCGIYSVCWRRNWNR